MSVSLEIPLWEFNVKGWKAYLRIRLLYFYAVTLGGWNLLCRIYTRWEDCGFIESPLLYLWKDYGGFFPSRYGSSKNIVQRIETVFSTKKEHNIFYYADNIHLTHNTYSTYAWIRKGKCLEQSTESNRDRININGLLNAHDATDIFINI